MSDLKIQGVVEMSSEGAERAFDRVADKAGQMTSRVEKEANKAGKAVDGIADGAGKSADEFTRAEGKIINSIKRVTRGLEEVGKTASQKIELRISERGLDPARFEPWLAKLREVELAQARATAGSAAMAAGYGGQFSNNVRNASFQIQDFAVQVNGGVDATKALAMQLPQMLVGFGTAGAVIGVVAALLPNLVQAFSNTAGASKTLGDAMSDFNKSTSAVGETVKKFDMQGLYEEFNKADAATKKSIVSQIEFQKAFIETQRVVAAKKFGESISGFTDDSQWGRLSKTFTSSAVTMTSGWSDIVASDLGIRGDLAKALIPALESVKRGTKDASEVFDQFGRKLLEGNPKAIELAKSLSEMAKTERDAASASDALTEAHMKMAGGHIQTRKEAEEAARGTKALAKEQAALADLLNTINVKDTGFDANYVKNVELLLLAYDKGIGKTKLSLEAFNDIFGRYVAMQPGAVAAKKAQTQAEEDYIKALSASIDPLEKQASTLEREVMFYGMTESAIQNTLVARLEEARAIQEANGVLPDHLALLDREIELRKRIATASSQKEFLDTNKRAAEASAREWEKFADDINRSLTDALFRAFESGSGFGKSFADTLGNTLKAAVAKALINVAITTGSNALNTGINALLGTSGANGGNGTNYLGLANGASSIYNLGSSAYGLYTNGLNYTLGSAVSSAGSYIGSLGTQAFGAGLANGGNVGTAISLYNSAAYTAAMEGVAAQASASAAQAAGNSAAAQAAAELAASKAAESAAYTATAEGLAAGSGANSTLSALSTYVGELASGPVGWVVAILTSMYQSNKLFKDGITWGNYTDQNKDTAKFWLNEPGLVRSIMDRDLANILGKDFVNSEFHQTVSLGSLAAALTTWVNGGLFGNTGQRGSVLAGSFSEDQGGFTGRSGAQMKKTGGFLSGSKEWTDWSDLPAATDLIFDVLYASVRGGFAGLGQAFKDDALMGKMKGFEYSYSGSGTDMEAYVKDMTEQLTTAIGKTLLPSIEGLAITTEENGKKITETWNQTFQRVVVEANAVNTVFDLLGNSLAGIYGNDTDKILAASDAFVQLFGSIDAMSTAINSYYDNFYTAEEKRQRQLVQIQQRLSAGGLNFSVAEIEAASRDTFRSVADALLKQGDAGAVAFKALMDVQGAFAELHPALESTTAAARAAADEAAALAAANEAAAEAARRSAEEITQSLLNGFDVALVSVRRDADLNLAALRTAAQLERDRITAARQAAGEQINGLRSMIDLLQNNSSALRGDTSAAGAFADDAAAWVRQAVSAATASGYMPDSAALADAISAARAGFDAPYESSFERDFAKLTLAGDLDRLQAVAGKQLPIAERALITADAQLAALDDSLRLAEQQVDALFGIDSSVITLQGSIASMSAEIVKAMNDSISGINASLIGSVRAGTIGSAEAADRLTGVEKDKVTTIGDRKYFVSSQGAIASDDGTITANNGWKGSIDDAKRIVAEAFYAMSPPDFYAAAKKVGLSSSMIDAMYGLEAGTALAWAKSNNLPAFSQGANRIPQDMLAIVHKDEAIVPAAYNPALGNSGNARLERLVEAMTLEIQRLNTDFTEMRRDTRRTANAVNGNPEQPMLVETVA